MMSMGEPKRAAAQALPSRRGRHRTAESDAEDRARVLAVAERVLEADGAEALSVRRIASEVGTSYQIVYTLFGSRAGLLDALFRRGFLSLAEQCRALPHTDSPAADLVSLAAAYRAFAHERPRLYALMFGQGIQGFAPDRQSRRVALESFQVVRDAARRVLESSPQARRLFQDEDALARAAWSATHGHVIVELDSWFGRDEGAADRLADTVRALVEGAIRPRPSGRPKTGTAP